MGKWTGSGFQADTLANYITNLQQAFIDALGSDFSVDPTTPQGNLIELLAEDLYNADMDGVEVAARFNINTAQGIYLDTIANLRGITRNPSVPEQITVTISSSSTGYTIPSGTIFNSVVGQFTNTADITVLSTSETAALSFTQDGQSGIIITDTLSTLQSFPAITNVVVTGITAGIPEETDMDLRQRLILTMNTSVGTVEHIVNKLIADPLVRSATYNYNDTGATVEGLPAWSTEMIVASETGVDPTLFNETVAKIILDNKVPSAQTAGDTTIESIDVFGNTKAVSFTVADNIPFAIWINIEPNNTQGTIDTSLIPEDKQAIVEYINKIRIGTGIQFSKLLSIVAQDPNFLIKGVNIKKIDDVAWTNNQNYLLGAYEYASIIITNVYIQQSDPLDG